MDSHGAPHNQWPRKLSGYLCTISGPIAHLGVNADEVILRIFRFSDLKGVFARACLTQSCWPTEKAIYPATLHGGAGVRNPRYPLRVKRRNTRCEHIESVLALRADSSRTSLAVRSVPISEVNLVIRSPRRRAPASSGPRRCQALSRS